MGFFLWTLREKIDNMSHIVQESQMWKLFNKIKNEKNKSLKGQAWGEDFLATTYRAINVFNWLTSFL